jgi:uncharacterized membrane protein YqhA
VCASVYFLRWTFLQVNPTHPNTEKKQEMPSRIPPRPSEDSKQLDRFSQIIGRSRFVVLLAVISVMLVAISLFLFGAIEAAVSIWRAWGLLINGELRSTQLTVQFLEIVSAMMKAVIFYIIGVGLYSLFISPLNLTVSLGVQTLNDLESKIISVVIVILGVTFLEHFIAWEQPLFTLEFGAAMALVIGALVYFQRFSQIDKESQKSRDPGEQVKAKQLMFHDEDEQAEIRDKNQPEDSTHNQSRTS